MQRPYSIILSHREKPYSKEIRPSVEEEKTWSQGPGNKGREAGFAGTGAGTGVNLGGGDSAFICITTTHCTQYVQFIIWIYRRFPLNIVFRRMSLRPLTWKDLLQRLHWDCVCFFFLILSVLGVHFLSTVRAEPRSGIHAPFLGPTWA